MRTRPIVLDLFAGAGGMSLGFEAAGFDIGGCVELDPIHCAVHEYNFPYAATICKNIAEVTVEEIEQKCAQKGFSHIDVIVGGPPCQGFSQIGKRQLDDPRNQLVFQFVRLVREIQPKYFVFENVKGMTLGNHKLFITELIDEFERSGYHVVQPYSVLNAADYGVAQNRQRFILLGIRTDQQPITYPRPAYVSAQQTQLTLFDQAYIGSREALGNLEHIAAFTEEDAGIPATHLHYSGYNQRLAYQNPTEFALCHVRTRMHDTIYGHLGSKHSLVSRERFAATEWGATEAVSRFFKLHPERPSNTLRAGTDSKRGAYTAARPIHYLQPRCITIREGARLHSFPDWFQFHTTIWHGFRQLGNSVAPLFAKALALEIQKGLGVDLSNLPIYRLPVSDEQLIRFKMSEACQYFDVPDVIGKRDRAPTTGVMT